MATTGLALRSHQMLVRAMEREPGQRRDFVRDACAGDHELLERVLKLLDAADRATSFLDTPALGLGSGPGSPSIPLPAPDAVGSYLVVGVLGSGGMATVYEAIQEDPERRVALKVLHRGVEDGHAYERFRFETGALARLKHPNIATIYEAGAAPLGGPAPSPFFAMELVESAEPITRYVIDRDLPMRERVRLFIAVCDAVHHGHQHGVIHRDIKPANVLVGGDGQPKVIDFGIAMAAGRDGQAVTTGLDRGQLIGTLTAMSPEQCETNGDDIDTRSDVYSLGVLLYEMVAGRPPHDFGEMGVPQAIRTIVEVDPPAPSTHNPAAKGDLDAIIGKAIRRDRRERYPGAASLAADLRRWLEHKPVEARPAGLPLVMRRFARRSPALSGAIAAAVLLLLAGVVVTSVLAVEANKARKQAEARERSLERVVQYQESLLATIDVAAIGDRMREGLVEAVGAGGEDEKARFAVTIGNVNFTSLALRAIDDAVLSPSHAAINEQFADDPELRARLLLRLGVSMYSLGLPASTEPVLRESLRIGREHHGDDHEQTLRSLNGLGLTLNALGRYEEAKEVMTEGYERSKRVLGPDALTTIRLGESLGLVHRALGELDAAQSVWRATYETRKRIQGEEHDETLSTLHNLAVLLATRGELEQAARDFTVLLDLRRRRFGADSPDVISPMLNLAIILRNRGEQDRAGVLLAEAHEIAKRQLGDSHPRTLRVRMTLAEAAVSAGDSDTARELTQSALGAFRNSLGETHPETLLARRLLAQLALDPDEARSVIAGFESSVGALHTLTLETRLILAQMLLDTGNADGSLAECEAALEAARSAPRPNQGLLGRLTCQKGIALLSLGRNTEARDLLTIGYDLLVESQGRDHVFTREAAEALRDAGGQAAP